MKQPKEEQQQASAVQGNQRQDKVRDEEIRQEILRHEARKREIKKDALEQSNLTLPYLIFGPVNILLRGLICIAFGTLMLAIMLAILTMGLPPLVPLLIFMTEGALLLAAAALIFFIGTLIFLIGISLKEGLELLVEEVRHRQSMAKLQATQAKEPELQEEPDLKQKEEALLWVQPEQNATCLNTLNEAPKKTQGPQSIAACFASFFKEKCCPQKPAAGHANDSAVEIELCDFVKKEDDSSRRFETT